MHPGSNPSASPLKYGTCRREQKVVLWWEGPTKGERGKLKHFCFNCRFYFLSQGLITSSCWSGTLLCRPGRTQTQRMPASASRVVGLNACTVVLGIFERVSSSPRWPWTSNAHSSTFPGLEFEACTVPGYSVLSLIGRHSATSLQMHSLKNKWHSWGGDLRWVRVILSYNLTETVG